MLPPSFHVLWQPAPDFPHLANLRCPFSDVPWPSLPMSTLTSLDYQQHAGNLFLGHTIFCKGVLAPCYWKCGPVTSIIASSESCFEMHTLGPALRPGLQTVNLHFSSIWKGFMCTFKFENISDPHNSKLTCIALQSHIDSICYTVNGVWVGHH